MNELIKRVVVEPGNIKLLVMVDGVQMRFDANLIDIVWKG